MKKVIITAFKGEKEVIAVTTIDENLLLNFDQYSSTEYSTNKLFLNVLTKSQYNSLKGNLEKCVHFLNTQQVLDNFIGYQTSTENVEFDESYILELM